IYVSDKLLKQFISDPLVVNTDIIFNKSYDRVLNTQVKDLVKNNKNISVSSKLDQADNMQQSENKMKILGGGLSAILALIGILNYINMMTSGIQSRKKELATLECVGMTQKQIRKMLTLEGLGYGVTTLLLVSTFGLGITYFIFQSSNTLQVDFVFPFIPVIMVYTIILGLCVSIPSIVYRFIQTESMIERLRGIE
ncbi:ABC transporter permease, partial [Bacillus sp. JJ722]|uniref:ABC transporter permease n=1 Tax=Bacillus sp. JJ722 TaxID=3122973 RepID=UPI002FFF8F62